MSDAHAQFISEAKQRIEALAEIRKRGGVKAYFLAQLGADLGKDRKRLEELTGKKLAEFVADELNFKIGSSDKHRTALYIYFDDEEPNVIKRTRYAKAFWDAFATPLSNDKNRYVNLDTFEFGQKTQVDAGKGSVREILPQYIVGGEAEGVADLISEKIRVWLEVQGIDPEFFVDPRSRQTPQPSIARQPSMPQSSMQSARGQASALDVLIGSLTLDQRQRTCLPLDVIETLISSRPAVCFGNEGQARDIPRRK